MIKDIKIGVHIHKKSTIVFTKKTPEKEVRFWLEKYPELAGTIIITDADNTKSNSANTETKPEQAKSKPAAKRKSKSK